MEKRQIRTIGALLVSISVGLGGASCRQFVQANLNNPSVYTPTSAGSVDAKDAPVLQGLIGKTMKKWGTVVMANQVAVPNSFQIQEVQSMTESLLSTANKVDASAALSSKVITCGGGGSTTISAARKEENSTKVTHVAKVTDWNFAYGGTKDYCTD